jgi:hypothetical protein
MQGDRFCYICGSPEHLARDCLENPELAHPPHPGMFGPGMYFVSDSDELK